MSYTKSLSLSSKGFAIMNATVFPKGDYFVLAVGGEKGVCVLYKIKFKIDDPEDLIDKENRQPG